MNKRNLTLLLLVGIVFVALAYVFSLQVSPTKRVPYYAQDTTSHTLTAVTHPGLHIGRFSFTDQRGETFTQQQTQHHIFIADYFFTTCPGICKDMGSQLQRVYQKFESNENVKILSHTSKPDEDSPDILMAYANKMGVTQHDKWLFLTGSKQDLYRMAREDYHIVDEPGDGGEDDFIHTERFVLVDREGYVRGYYDGTNPMEVDKLMKDIELLLEE